MLTNPLLGLDDVSKSYSTSAEVIRAVKDVSLSAAAGEFVAIYGPSGSGKSTLLKLIAGLVLPDEGEIRIGSQVVNRLDEDDRAGLRRNVVGMVFQGDALIEEFRSGENVALALEAQGASTAVALREASALLDRVGLTGLDDRWPAQLSGGQRQRVGIARALAGGRSVLIADEPTGSLDSATSVELFALFAELCQGGALAVVCSHDPICRRYADSSYEMNDGCLRQTR